MYNEVFFTAVALMLVCLVLLVLDLLVSGVVALLGGPAFGRVFSWGLLSLIVPAVLLAYGILIERNQFRVKEIELGFDNLPVAYDGYRVAHISDIHSRSWRLRPGVLKKGVDLVNALHPDLIAFTGDLITLVPEELDVTGPVLSALSAPDGVVSVLGNHDYRPDTEEALRDLEARERGLGWRLLLNEHLVLHRGGDSLAVVGVENTTTSEFFPSRGDLSGASEGTDGMFRILLSHDPLHWDSEVLGKDYPLTLSGHTHAAQLSFLGWSPARVLFPRVRGLFREGGQYLYINVGMGETAFPARIGVRPEITLITLKRL